MPDVNVGPFEIEVKARHGDLVRADVYQPKGEVGPYPTVLGASPYQKLLRPLPVVPSVFSMIEYRPMQLDLDDAPLANPELPERLRIDAALNKADLMTFYGIGPKGYTDYPALGVLASA